MPSLLSTTNGAAFGGSSRLIWADASLGMKNPLVTKYKRDGRYYPVMHVPAMTPRSVKHRIDLPEKAARLLYRWESAPAGRTRRSVASTDS